MCGMPSLLPVRVVFKPLESWGTFSTNQALILSRMLSIPMGSVHTDSSNGTPAPTPTPPAWLQEIPRKIWSPKSNSSRRLEVFERLAATRQAKLALTLLLTTNAAPPANPAAVRINSVHPPHSRITPLRKAVTGHKRPAAVAGTRRPRERKPQG